MMNNAEIMLAETQDAGLFLYLGHEQFVLHLKEKEENAILARFRYLVRKRLVRISRIGERLHLSLTDVGRVSMLKKRVASSKPRADGKRLLVLFDIPVAAGRARQRLRRFLKETGFTMLQRSVWQTDKDASLPLREWLKRERLEEWIAIMLVEPV